MNSNRNKERISQLEELIDVSSFNYSVVPCTSLLLAVMQNRPPGSGPLNSSILDDMVWKGNFQFQCFTCVCVSACVMLHL